MAGLTDTLESLHHVRVFVSAGLGRQDSLMQSAPHRRSVSTAELGGLCSFLVGMEGSRAHVSLDACPDYCWNPSSPPHRV